MRTQPDLRAIALIVGIIAAILLAIIQGIGSKFGGDAKSLCFKLLCGICLLIVLVTIIVEKIRKRIRVGAKVLVISGPYQYCEGIVAEYVRFIFTKGYPVVSLLP